MKKYKTVCDQYLTDQFPKGCVCSFSKYKTIDVLVSKVGRPSKPKTITPGLRIDKNRWDLVSAKYPRQINKMFNIWIEGLLTK